MRYDHHSGAARRFMAQREEKTPKKAKGPPKRAFH
jgi:hypothetical protein